MQPEQVNETLSTCRFAQRMTKVAVNAQRNSSGMSSVHGNLMKLDPSLQQYLTVCFSAPQRNLVHSHKTTWSGR